MELFIYDSYEEMSAEAAKQVINNLTEAKHPLFCVASGDSPIGLYNNLIRRHRAGHLSVDNWYFLGLDEWLGLGKNDEGSCRYMLDKSLFEPLELSAAQICFFDGKTETPESECERIEHFIKEKGPIDVAILGLGMNGHIGLNEPGSCPDLRSHVSTIDSLTQQVGQKYFSRPQQLSKGITLGLATLMEARYLILIVNGEKKAAIVQQAIEGEVTEKVPASLLREHPNFYIYLDKAAASFLKK